MTTSHPRSGLMDGLWETLSPRGLHLVLAGGTPEHRAAGLFNRRSVDGIIFVAPPAEADPELDSIAAAGFPAVCIGSRPSHPGLACVDIDNAAAGRQATNVLIDAGHRRILHLAGPLSVNSSARERLAGYRSALAAAGIPEDPALIHDCSYNGEFAIDAEVLVNGGLCEGNLLDDVPTDAGIALDQDLEDAHPGRVAEGLRQVGQFVFLVAERQGITIAA